MLLKGGFGSEREISLRSAKACAEAIKENDLRVTEVDIGLNGINELTSLNVDVCFNALHGKFGEDGTVQGFLNLIKIPYTCLLYTSPSPRDATLSRMPSSA